MNNTMKLSEKELMHDLLASEKQVITAYSTGMTETSCSNLKNTLMNNYRNVQDIEFKIFDTMNKKGWYQVKDAMDSEVQQVKDSVTKMSGELK